MTTRTIDCLIVGNRYTFEYNGYNKEITIEEKGGGADWSGKRHDFVRGHDDKTGNYGLFWVNCIENIEDITIQEEI